MHYYQEGTAFSKASCRTGEKRMTRSGLQVCYTSSYMRKIKFPIQIEDLIAGYASKVWGRHPQSQKYWSSVEDDSFRAAGPMAALSSFPIYRVAAFLARPDPLRWNCVAIVVPHMTEILSVIPVMTNKNNRWKGINTLTCLRNNDLDLMLRVLPTF
jgi:hypothetical protein